MGNLPKSQSLLSRVATRLRIASIGRRLYLCTLICAGVYLAALLISRLGGFATIWFQPISLLSIPVAAVLLAVIFHKRPNASDAARKVDEHTKSKDLYLTVANLESTSGDYQSLVARDAEEKAGAIRPDAVVPFQWQDRVPRVLAAAVILAAAVFFTPQLDPFGKVAEANETQTLKKELRQAKKATTARAEQLKKDKESGDAKDVEEKLGQLKKTFDKAKPGKKKQNYDALKANQNLISQKWKKLNNKQLSQMLSKRSSEQSFGGINNEKMEKMLKQLQEGSTEALKQEMGEMQKTLEKLMKATDPKEKAKLARELKKKLQQMEKFASEKAGSKQMQAALKRAMKQLEMAKSEEMSKEAMEALKQSMDLSEQEMEQLAQSVKDLKKLEEGLKALNMAKQLNEQDKLDGEQCEGCQSMEDYAELYAKTMAEMGMGEGEGEGDKDINEGEGGVGRGGKSPEDESQVTNFKDEKSKSEVRVGKVLLSVKTKGLSDEGEAKKEYRDAISQVKEGLSEALDQENIPPGYVEGIKKYFDDIEKTLEPGDVTPEAPAADGGK